VARGRLTRSQPPTLGVRPGPFLAIPLIAAVLFVILPLAAVADRALSDSGATGFADVISSPLFIDAFKRTLLLSFVVAALCAVAGTTYALALVAVPRRLAYGLLAILLSTFWLSFLVRTFGWVLLFQPNGALDQALQDAGLTSDSLGLLQTTTAMYPAMVHVMFPFLVLPVYAACLRLDPELLYAGQSLGAKPLSVIRHVVLPQLRPAILAGASLVFILSLAFFVTPLLIGGPSQLTVATLIDRQFSQLYDIGGAATIALVLLVAVLVLYLVADRFVNLIPVGDD
jgi:ABC-type spermidine/putrescine transport system permease subunit I